MYTIHTLGVWVYAKPRFQTDTTMFSHSHWVPVESIQEAVEYLAQCNATIPLPRGWMFYISRFHAYLTNGFHRYIFKNEFERLMASGRYTYDASQRPEVVTPTPEWPLD